MTINGRMFGTSPIYRLLSTHRDQRSFSTEALVGLENQRRAPALSRFVLFGALLSTALASSHGTAADTLRTGTLKGESTAILSHGEHRTSGPTIQLDAHGTVHLAWSQDGPRHPSLYYWQWPRTSQEAPPIQEAVRVNPETHRVASLHEPPALSLANDSTTYILWTAPHPRGRERPFASVLLLSRSTDGGRTFLDPVQVNDDQAVTGHSFDSLTVAPDGTVHFAWLDAGEGQKAPAVYTARSTDRGRTISPNIKIDNEACVCCRTTMATAKDGTLYVAWRKVLPGNVREVVVARSRDHGVTFSRPVIVGHDQWVFAGCPHRPASMGVDGRGRVYVVWYTEGPDDTPGVYFAFSDDRGRTFTPRTRLNIATGTFPDHPQMAVDARGRIVVVWEEQSPVRREVVVSYSLDRGKRFTAPRRLNTQKAKRPVVAVNDHGDLVLAWLERLMFPHWSTILRRLSIEHLHEPPAS